MWRNLGNLSIKRNWTEALIFYVIYGAAGIFLCGAITSFIAQLSVAFYVEDPQLFAIRIAPVLGGIYTLIIAVSLIIFKNIGKDALAVLCAIAGALGSASLGLVFGFIPVAILTGFEAEKERVEVEV